jgi:hypothetical protein
MPTPCTTHPRKRPEEKKPTPCTTRPRKKAEREKNTPTPHVQEKQQKKKITVFQREEKGNPFKFLVSGAGAVISAKQIFSGPN